MDWITELRKAVMAEDASPILIQAAKWMAYVAPGDPPLFVNVLASAGHDAPWDQVLHVVRQAIELEDKTHDAYADQR